MKLKWPWPWSRPTVLTAPKWTASRSTPPASASTRKKKAFTRPKTAQDTADAALALQTSFHYEGYNFDSQPEAEFLDWTLGLLQAHPHQIEGLWFTGSLTDSGKTDLRAEYLGDDGRWHTYTPDFVLRRADGKHLVVEVKDDRFSPDINADLPRHSEGQAPKTLEGRKAVPLKRWEQLNPERLSYHVMFADTALLDAGKKTVRDFILGQECIYLT